jgi:hypothetical protein
MGWLPFHETKKIKLKGGEKAKINRNTREHISGGDLTA